MKKLLQLRPRVNPEIEAACRTAIAWTKARQNDRYVWMALKRRPELGTQMVRLLSEEGLEFAGLADAVAKRHGLPGPLADVAHPALQRA